MDTPDVPLAVGEAVIIRRWQQSHASLACLLSQSRFVSVCALLRQIADGASRKVFWEASNDSYEGEDCVNESQPLCVRLGAGDTVHIFELEAYHVSEAGVQCPCASLVPGCVGTAGGL